jgi:hypothetical protein
VERLYVTTMKSMGLFFARLKWVLKPTVTIQTGGASGGLSVSPSNFDLDRGQPLCIQNQAGTSIDIEFPNTKYFGVKLLATIPHKKCVTIALLEDAPLSLDGPVKLFVARKTKQSGGPPGGGPLVSIKDPPGDSD